MLMFVNVTPFTGLAVLQPEYHGCRVRRYMLTIWNNKRRFTARFGRENLHGIERVADCPMVEATLDALVGNILRLFKG